MTDEEKIKSAYHDFVDGDDFDYDAYDKLFSYAVQWRDENPGPKVLALVEAMSKALKARPSYNGMGLIREALAAWNKE
jgi:hypothetical protein